MSKHQTKEYFSDYYKKNFKIFSNKHKHRVTEHNRTNPWWTCNKCVDLKTCMRFERVTRVGCESKLTKGDTIA